MPLEQLSYAAQIIGTVGVVLSLIFVGLQIQQNTKALQRNEHNSTMAQWSVIRMGIAQSREIGVLMTSGLNGEHALDRADQLRLDQLLAEYAWAAFHIWDRTRQGVFPKGTFELTGGALLCEVLSTPRGNAWWRSAKSVGFVPEYVADVDAPRSCPHRRATSLLQLKSNVCNGLEADDALFLRVLLFYSERTMARSDVLIDRGRPCGSQDAGGGLRRRKRTARANHYCRVSSTAMPRLSRCRSRRLAIWRHQEVEMALN